MQKDLLLSDEQIEVVITENSSDEVAFNLLIEDKGLTNLCFTSGIIKGIHSVSQFCTVSDRFSYRSNAISTPPINNKPADNFDLANSVF